MNRFSKYLVLLLFAVASATGCGGGSSSSDEGENVARGDACSDIGLAKVANADECAAGANPTASPLVRLRIFSADGSEGLCTGAVVDESLILTAAHCFLDEVVAVEADTFAGSFSGVVFQSSPFFAVLPSPFFPDAELFSNDLAVVQVNGSINTAKARLLASRAPIVGERAIVAGFGEFTPGTTDGEIRAGNAIVQNVTEQHVFISYEGNQSHPCQGDSGGPIFVEVEGELAIAGVVSQSDPQVDPNTICRPGDITLYTNTQSAESQAFLSSVAPGVGSL